MTSRLRSRALALAAGSALTVLPVNALADCAASSVGSVASVNVTCNPEPGSVARFATSFLPNSSSLPGSPYNGNGNDSLVMTGGNVLASIPSGFSGVIVDNITDPPLFLNLPISNNIEMLDGNDFVDISGGTIGTAAAPVGLDLGAEADQFDMTGGSITGSVFGGDGNDDIEVSGNAIITGVPGISRRHRDRRRQQ